MNQHVNIKDLQKNLLMANQSVISFKNIADQFHKLMFLTAMELRSVDRDNRLFSNGSYTKAFLEKIDMAVKIDKRDLPKESLTDFKGDNKPGLPPSAIKG